MKTKVLIALSMVLVLLAAGTAFAANKKSPAPKKEITYITDGEIAKVDVKKGEIYIKKNKKNIKFNAGIEVCKQAAKKKGKKVSISYIIKDNGSMFIKELTFVGKK